ncbi:MAG: energy transducer TonB [Acidobacteriaceae bacterium]
MFPQIFSFSLIVFLASALGFAQNSGPATTQSGGAAVAAASVPAMPKDPKELLLLAARVNGLAGIDRPFHVKANYQTFDADGKPKDQGVFEEWWAGPEKYKISYSSAGFNQVEYRNNAKTYMVGDVKWPPIPDVMIKQYLLNPLPSEDVVSKVKYVAKDARDGTVALRCIYPAAQQEGPAASGYCFGGKLPAIRLEMPNAQIMTFFNTIFRVNDRYVAKQIRVRRASKPYLNADVTVLDYPAKLEDADFVAPAGATAVQMEGTVILHAVINKNGEIGDLRAISGPAFLRQAAIESVQMWPYRPYLLNGRPVKVETQIKVVFKPN